MPTFPGNALTEEEKERVRYHMGYLGVSDAASLSFGIPASRQTLFLIENAMNRLMAFSAQRVRAILAVLDDIEQQMVDPGHVLLYAEQLGELKLRSAKAGETSTDLLEREYVRWAQRLSDVTGCPLYPYSARFQRKGPGSIPVVR